MSHQYLFYLLTFVDWEGPLDQRSIFSGGLGGKAPKNSVTLNKVSEKLKAVYKDFYIDKLKIFLHRQQITTLRQNTVYNKTSMDSIKFCLLNFYKLYSIERRLPFLGLRVNLCACAIHFIFGIMSNVVPVVST